MAKRLFHCLTVPTGHDGSVCSTVSRGIALALLLFFSLALTAPLFAPDADAHLPACCRKNGKHHCMMRMMEQLTGAQRGFTTVSEKCPCCPSSAWAGYSPIGQATDADEHYAEVFQPLARVRQAEAHLRVSSSRSHQKRGPPSPLA